jgi:hypothetical protein
MNSVLISLLVSIVKQLISAALFQFITNAVERAETSGDEGTKKRAAVIEQVRNLPVFSQTANWLINLAIEAAVAKLKVTK